MGLEVLGVGVTDIILTGDMKDILNGVVQAEKNRAGQRDSSSRGKPTPPFVAEHCTSD